MNRIGIRPNGKSGRAVIEPTVVLCGQFQIVVVRESFLDLGPFRFLCHGFGNALSVDRGREHDSWTPALPDILSAFSGVSLVSLTNSISCVPSAGKQYRQRKKGGKQS